MKVKPTVFTLFSILIIVFFAFSLNSQDTENDQRFSARAAEIAGLQKEGRFDEALAKAEELLAWAVDTFSENHLNTASAFDLAGGVHVAAGKPRKASPLYSRADAIRLGMMKEFVTGVYFFECGNSITPYKDRVYRTQFLASLSRYINWEINFKHPPFGRRLDFNIDVVWRNPDGSEMYKQNKETYHDASWTSPWTAWGYGNQSASSWKPGKYTIDFSVQGVPIARASFEVLSDAEAGFQFSTLWSGLVPLFSGSSVISQDAFSSSSSMAHALIETPLDKTGAFFFYRDRLQQDGWVLDQGIKADDEKGSLNNENMWGLINLNKNKITLTILILSDKKTGGDTTRVDFNLINRGAGEAIADFVKKIPRVQVADAQMNDRFQNDQWGVTVLSAKAEGMQIKKTEGFMPGRSYTFFNDIPDTYLLRVVLDLERLDKKPIKESFLLQPEVRDGNGHVHACIAAGTDMGEYYDFRKKNIQSLLMPVQPKSQVEYVFAVPRNATVLEFLWPDLAPIRIAVK